jgi:hypothetical protein
MSQQQFAPSNPAVQNWLYHHRQNECLARQRGRYFAELVKAVLYMPPIPKEWWRQKKGESRPGKNQSCTSSFRNNTIWHNKNIN